MAGERETSPQNKQILKRLLADPGNKTCADCKTATHPRWASWNLGIFLCIRCSGVHRSLGTHISKVRSVDLDSWTDMHLEQMVRWGNRRANVYWEAKLGPNYVPDASKIVNFIKTKYDLKRWVSSPTLPDPATLDMGKAASEDIPLDQVKQKLVPQPQSIDLLGGYDSPAPRAAPTSAPVTRSTARPTVSLLDLDAPAPLATPEPSTRPAKSAPPAPSATARTGPVLSRTRPSPSPAASAPVPAPETTSAPTSASNPASTQRVDLKKSILSLYAQKPQPVGRPAVPPATVAPVAPAAPAGSVAQTTSTFGSNDLADLSFGSWTTASQPAPPKTSLADSLAGLSFQPKTSTPSNTPAPTVSLISESSTAATTPAPATSTSAWAPITSVSTSSVSTPAPMSVSTSSLVTEEPEDDIFANVWK